MHIPNFLKTVIDDLPQCLLVGGCVRDHFLGLKPKDFDVEVYNITTEELIKTLKKHGKVDAVGQSFGVLKLHHKGEVYDFSQPRRDSRKGVGHKEFEIEVVVDMSPKEAGLRRDFTINSMGYDPKTNQIVDFHNGMNDLKNGIIRHTSDAFSEDPLRVLRACQFAARFGFDVAPETVELCRSMKYEYSSLTPERVGEEWHKFFTKAQTPSKGLNFLKECEWIGFYPELQHLIGVQQEPEWHPEGDAWVHTLHCIDAMAELTKDLDPKERMINMVAILCHDLGKATCTRYEMKNGAMRWTSHGHEAASVPLAEQFFKRISCGFRDAAKAFSRIAPMIGNHMVREPDIKDDRQIRHLAEKLYPATIVDLCNVITSDNSGRPPMPKGEPDYVTNLLKRAEALNVKNHTLPRVVSGKALIDSGIPQGKEIGEMLNRVRKKELDGLVKTEEDGVNWLFAQPELVQAKGGPFGDDLIARGFAPGKIFGIILGRAAIARKEGKISNRDEALSWLDSQPEIINEISLTHKDVEKGIDHVK